MYSQEEYLVFAKEFLSPRLEMNLRLISGEPAVLA